MQTQNLFQGKTTCPNAQQHTPSSNETQKPKAYWSGVLSLFMGVTSLIAAEFIPVSLLTPMAQDLGISEGMAGQSVTAVGLFAVIASLLISPMARRMNRKYILLAFSLLLTFSNLLVAVAPNYLALLLGRCLLGVCVGGFWSLVPAVTLQLVPSNKLPRALSIVYAGVSVATIVSLPLSSYLGHLLGWRNVFMLAAAMGILMFVWQFLALPALPSRSANSFKNMFALLRQNWVLAGMGGIIFSYGGYHVFFTYLRPFLEYDLALQSNMLAGALLAFGLANCLGTFAAGFILNKWFKLALPLVFIVFVCIAVLLLGSQDVFLRLFLVITWGFLFGFIPVGWSIWIARTLAQSAELAGGLSVAFTQFSMGLVAALGGATFDHTGISGNFLLAIFFLALAFILVKTCFALHAKANGETSLSIQTGIKATEVPHEVH